MDEESKTLKAGEFEMGRLLRMMALEEGIKKQESILSS